MKTPTTATKKKRSLFLLAAVLLVFALLATEAESSRYLPNALATPQTPPRPILDDVDQVDAEDFWLFSETDVERFGILAVLDASDLEHLVAENRIRLFEESGAIPRPLEWFAISKLASGLSTCSEELNVWQTGGLGQNCGSPSFQGLWTDPTTGIAYARNRWYDARNASWLSEDPMGAVDSPNLYAFVGWGPHMGTDPMGRQGVGPLGGPVGLFGLFHDLREQGIDVQEYAASETERSIDEKVAEFTGGEHPYLPDLFVDWAAYSGGESVSEYLAASIRFGQGIDDLIYGEGFKERSMGLLKDTARGLTVAGPVIAVATAGGGGGLSGKVDEGVGALKKLGRWVKGWFKREVADSTDLVDDTADASRRLLGTAPEVVTSKLTREASDALRTEARDIWQAAAGRRAIWDDLQIHHRVPLEWSHVFSRANPNRLSNLVGAKSGPHSQITKAWAEWKKALGGRVPTQEEVLGQALRIDDQFKEAWVFAK